MVQLAAVHMAPCAVYVCSSGQHVLHQRQGPNHSAPAINSSQRSTQPGLERCGLASGDISSGWSVTKVGCTSVPSTTASNTSFRITPTLGPSAEEVRVGVGLRMKIGIRVSVRVRVRVGFTVRVRVWVRVGVKVRG